jgi:hypothetical protein
MDFNSLFFPAPTDKYSCVTHFGEMIYLPKFVSKQQDGSSIAKVVLDTTTHEDENCCIYIPCLMIQHKNKSNLLKKENTSKIVVYFHGNAEDVNTSYDFTLKMSLTFRCNVLSVEYPGYGLY